MTTSEISPETGQRTAPASTAPASTAPPRLLRPARRDRAERPDRRDDHPAADEQRCTVGALRAEVAGHDVSVRSRDKGRFTKSVGIEMGKLAGNATA